MNGPTVLQKEREVSKLEVSYYNDNKLESLHSFAHTCPVGALKMKENFGGAQEALYSSCGHVIQVAKSLKSTLGKGKSMSTWRAWSFSIAPYSEMWSHKRPGLGGVKYPMYCGGSPSHPWAHTCIVGHESMGNQGWCHGIWTFSPDGDM